jgi:hypothetical protein
LCTHRNDAAELDIRHAYMQPEEALPAVQVTGPAPKVSNQRRAVAIQARGAEVGPAIVDNGTSVCPQQPERGARFLCARAPTPVRKPILGTMEDHQDHS